ncbi:MAG: Hsp33 family molecular chaperone HslO [Verrucomicrobiota bacterium]
MEVHSHYIRARNCLFIEARLASLYMDYYLHLQDHELRYTQDQDRSLKEALACLLLHLVSRPREETVAWTMNFSDPAMNLFVTGNSRPGQITGRIFTEEVREARQNLFYSQVQIPDGPSYNSMVKVEGRAILSLVEQFYDQSEQLPARFFELPDERFCVVKGMPEADESWLRSLTLPEVEALRETETVKFLETRSYRFDCGCRIDRILPALSGIASRDMEELFGGQEVIRITCPRCGLRYALSRDMMKAFLERENLE